ncbi:hypothetical protein ABFX02_14G216300 [Erythranthe guttata]
MDNRKGKSQMYPFSTSDQVIELDLTLKLGLSINDTQNVEENKDVNFSLQLGQGGSGKVVELNSSSAGNYYNIIGNESVGTNYNLFYHGCSSRNNPKTPSRKRVNNNGENGASAKICNVCGSDSTPLWRKGPDGPQTLCNACGLRHLRSLKKKSST